MAELRWNPMIRDWVMCASNRQARPNMPRDWCPFCPGPNKKVPEQYDVFKYDNDFPALSTTPPAMDMPITPAGHDLYKVAPSYGKCEVILFSPDHHGNLCDLSDAHMRRLVDLWSERYAALSADENVRYVFIFENRGELVGVSMPHPHGQIYAYSKLPKKIEEELESAQAFYSEEGKCLFCRINEEERAFGERVIYENDSFAAYIPFFADYTYGVYIAAKAHKGSLSDFDDAERNDLGDIIRTVTGAFDALFDMRFPYMMCMHNAPCHMEYRFPNAERYSHFHIEFYPPLRAADKQQFQASSETGVWAHCNPTRPEDKAVELRAAVEKFRARMHH